MKRVAVIGAGLGGLATAARLARAGYDVTLFEQNSTVGGKMSFWQEGGYTFDTGPTLLTMPFVVQELFAACGARIEDRLDLVPMEPICRTFFPDGTRMDTSADEDEMVRRIGLWDPDESRRFRDFLDHGKRIYDAALEPFLQSGFASLNWKGLTRSLRYLPSILRIDPFRTLDAAVRSSFHDPRLRQLMNRFATYNGSSPYRVPATLAIIPYVEFRMGGWYVRGGMYRLAAELARLAEEAGVVIRTGCGVGRILAQDNVVTGVQTEEGESVPADAVVSNADAFYTGRALLDGVPASGLRREREASLSGFVVLLGVRREFPDLAHHNVFFSPDYREEFKMLFDEGLPASDPTVYIAISSKTDPVHAPAGSSNLFVLVNVPPVSTAFDWEQNKMAYRDTVLRTLARRGVGNIADAIQTEKIITPVDFERQFHAYRGGIYGSSSNGRFAAFLRPPNRLTSPRGLYLVGGSSHPGGGIPLVLLSGKIVAWMVDEDLSVS